MKPHKMQHCAILNVLGRLYACTLHLKNFIMILCQIWLTHCSMTSSASSESKGNQAYFIAIHTSPFTQAHSISTPHWPRNRCSNHRCTLSRPGTREVHDSFGFSVSCTTGKDPKNACIVVFFFRWLLASLLEIFRGQISVYIRCLRRVLNRNLRLLLLRLS